MITSEMIAEVLALGLQPKMVTGTLGTQRENLKF